MNKKWLHSFVAGLFLLAGTAQAVIIDNGTYTTNTASGLDWLDVTQTLGLSFDEVTAKIKDGELLGWRYANGAQFNQLITDATGVVIQPGSLAVSNDSPYFIDLMHMLGTTTSVIDACCAEGGRLVSYEFVQGWLDQPPRWLDQLPSLGGSALVGAELIYFDGAGHSLISTNNGFSTNSTVPHWGSYLIRDTLVVSVPEPETYALILAGLGMLGLTLRRNTKQQGE
jgi:hypothetical protein